MGNILDTVRGIVPAAARDKVYTLASAGVLLLAGLGLISDEVAPLWFAVAGASVVLLFAVLHATSPWRAALYGFIAVLAPLALWYSLGTATGWAAVLTFAATALGITKAAGSTPAAGGRHRAPELPS